MISVLSLYFMICVTDVLLCSFWDLLGFFFFFVPTQDITHTQTTLNSHGLEILMNEHSVVTNYMFLAWGEYRKIK